MNRKPLYCRPWLWIVVLLLLIAGGWFINHRSQTQEAQRDTVAKTSKKTDKKKKVAKKPQDKEKIIPLLNRQAVDKRKSMVQGKQ